MKRINIATLVALILIVIIIVVSNIYISDASNFISIEKLQDDLGTKTYDELVDFNKNVGISEEEFEEKIIEQQSNLQQELDGYNYIEKINFYVFASYNKKDSTSLVESENDFIDELSNSDKKIYSEIFNESRSND